MKHSFLLAVLLTGLLLLENKAAAQVGIGTTNPHTSSMLEISSSDKGLLVPRMTRSERDAIPAPATGLLVYQTDNVQGLYYNSGTPESPVWGLVGNNSGQWQTNGTSLYYEAGNVGIGTSNPEESLTVAGTLDIGNVLVHNGKRQIIFRQAANTDIARGNALAAAFSASIAGDNIIIGNGNYSISATLALKGSQTIILQGANLTSTNSSISIFTATDVSNWQIKGSGLLTGAGPPSGGSFTNERGIAILKGTGVCSNWEITGLSFTNFRGCAIFSNGSSGSYPYDKGGSIHNNNIYGNNFGIYFDSPTNYYTPHYIAITDNHLYNNNNYAVYIMGGNIMIDHNIISSNASGIYLGAGYNHAHGIISSNEINHNNVYGIYVDAIIHGETVADNHILVNQANVYLNGCKGVNITGGMIYNGISYDIVMNGTFTDYNYVTNVNSSNSPLDISATPAQRAKLIVHECFSTSNQNPPWNDPIPVKDGVADSVLRPDYSNGGLLSMQAMPPAAGQELLNSMVPKSEIFTVATGIIDSISLSLTGVQKIPLEYSDGFVIDTLIFIGTGISCDISLMVRYGPDIADTGTAVFTGGHSITSVSTVSKISSFDNPTVAKGNLIWIEPKYVNQLPRRVVVFVKGHRI